MKTLVANDDFDGLTGLVAQWRRQEMAKDVAKVAQNLRTVAGRLVGALNAARKLTR